MTVSSLIGLPSSSKSVGAIRDTRDQATTAPDLVGRGQVVLLIAATNDPAAGLVERAQLSMVIHFIGGSEQRYLHGKVWPDTTASDRHHLALTGVWIVSLRIDNAGCAILTNAFDQQDMLEGTIPCPDPTPLQRGCNSVADF